MNKEKHYTIQEIFSIYGKDYIDKYSLSLEQQKVFNAISNCNTSKLGYHICTCRTCKERYFSFNSCRNRYCPTCQEYAKEKWLHKESNNLLNCKYFYITTTIPSKLNKLFFNNQKICYNILFKATSQTILELNKISGITLGITSILHTWNQFLNYSPHIHSIITSGGIKNNQWIYINNDELFNIQTINTLFTNKLISYLQEEFNNLVLPNNISDYDSFTSFLLSVDYSSLIFQLKPSKIDNITEYIASYAFIGPISDNQIKGINNGYVTFSYQDNVKPITLPALEFIKRFLYHVLPNNYTKVKHYGLFSNKNKTIHMKLCKLLISKIITKEFITSISKRRPFKCLKCGSTTFIYSFLHNRL